MEPWVVGVDLGGTKIEFGLIDPENKIIARKNPTHAEEGPKAAVERMAAVVGEFAGYLPEGESIASWGSAAGPRPRIRGVDQSDQPAQVLQCTFAQYALGSVEYPG
jgi:predicted NBD/HSP70 family sugar kinase